MIKEILLTECFYTIRTAQYRVLINGDF